MNAKLENAINKCAQILLGDIFVDVQRDTDNKTGNVKVSW